MGRIFLHKQKVLFAVQVQVRKKRDSIRLFCYCVIFTCVVYLIFLSSEASRHRDHALGVQPEVDNNTIFRVDSRELWLARVPYSY